MKIFNSHYICDSLGKLPKIIRVVAQPGSAFVWGARGRWFESSPPDGIYEVELLVNQGFYFKSKNYQFLRM